MVARKVANGLERQMPFDLLIGALVQFAETPT